MAWWRGVVVVAVLASLLAAWTPIGAAQGARCSDYATQAAA
jgi:hypothetical protein